VRQERRRRIEEEERTKRIEATGHGGFEYGSGFGAGAGGGGGSGGGCGGSEHHSEDVTSPSNQLPDRKFDPDRTEALYQVYSS
jgi:hypothetical protein